MNEIRGIVQQGVVVLQDGALPDGTQVTVVPIGPAGFETGAAAPGTGATEPPSVWNKLVELGLAVEREPCDLPSDLAANHDHYLHGLPKRQ